ncbi:HEAT repeat domain-containing protein [Sphingomonas kaistensis]|uniref:HEAT repeat domain-containing protein n=1 Tax=Sphingomonas kaistensis TaxID=298708 RepID=A0ABZ2G1M5_9SPHN
MISLEDLWLLSLGLSLLALVIMGGLIAGRLVAVRRARTMKHFRAQWLPQLLGNSPDLETGSLPDHPALLSELTAELIAMVRGDERAAFVAMATRLGVARTLHRSLRRGSVRQRILAAETLAYFADGHSTDALDLALDDTNADVRLTAALALACSDRAPAIAELVDRLRLGTAEQSMLVVSLVAEVARDRPEEVRQLLFDPTTISPIKAAAIDALSGSGDYTLVPVITDLALSTADEAPELPRYLRALGQLGHPAARPAVLRNLASKVWFVRAAAAEAAGRVGLVDAVETLLGLLDDPDWWVRYRAGEALARLGATGQGMLKEMSCLGSLRARKAARLALVEQAVPR